jgi:hypothetical protein
MIKFLLTLCICLSMNMAFAQPDKKVVSDTVEISVGNKTLSIITDSTNGGKKDVRWTRNEASDDSDNDYDDDDDDDGGSKKVKSVDFDLLNIDLGAQFLTYDQRFDIPVEYNALDIKPMNSTSLSLHVAKTKFRMLKGHVNLITAVTFENNRFAFREPISFIPSQDSLTIVPDSGNIRKHKLIVWYAQIPLLLKFETNPSNKNKNFHFAVGGYAGLLLGAHTKKKFSNGDKLKVNDDFNLANFRYGAMARIGFRGIELYAKYDLSPLFRENQGPAIHPITFGISLTGSM